MECICLWTAHVLDMDLVLWKSDISVEDFAALTDVF